MKKQSTPKDGVLTFEMECFSDPKEVSRVEPFLMKVNKVAHLDDGTFYRLLVASTEAVNNAILHGNKSDPKKQVCLTCEFRRNDSIIIRVTDEGSGFNPDGLPNPLADKNLMKTSGRGVFLMKELMDDVRFRIFKGGSSVEMRINLRRLK